MVTDEEFESILTQLKYHSDEAVELIFYRFRWWLSNDAADQWNEQLKRINAVVLPGDFVHELHFIVRTLYETTERYKSYLTACCGKRSTFELDGLLNRLRTDIDVLLLASSSLFVSAIQRLYDIWIRIHSNSNEFFGLDDASSAMTNVCLVCQQNLPSDCRCADMLSIAPAINQHLQYLGLFDNLSNTLIYECARRWIDERVAARISAVGGDSVLPQMTQWLRLSVHTWYPKVALSSGSESEEQLRLNTFCELTERTLITAVGTKLISFIWNLILEYPDTVDGLEDLKVCQKADPSLRRLLVATWASDIKRKLLNPGVNTSDILTFYGDTVKCMRRIDPSGVLMAAACLPMKVYLRGRSDTVRCIVGFLTRDDSGIELLNSSGVVSDGNSAVQSDDEDQVGDDELSSWADWTPDPIDAPVGESKHDRQQADVISMLIGIYGSKDLFVKEYRASLAERLLKQGSTTTADMEVEQRHLQMLKVRFGDTDLHQCEVMLKDIRDSHKQNRLFSSAAMKLEEGTVGVSCRILSDQFWPKLREDRITLPDQLQSLLDAYKKSFEETKKDRTLQWKPSLGSVEVELSGSVSVNTGPVQAAILHLFADKDELSVSEIAKQLQCGVGLVRRRVQFWISLGVLAECGADNWRWTGQLPSEKRLASLRDSAVAGHDADTDDEEEGGCNESEIDALEQYWSYMCTMFRTSDTLKAERVHNLLKYFASPGQEGPSLDTVNAFLQRKVKEQLLVHISGVYKLPKSV